MRRSSIVLNGLVSILATGLFACAPDVGGVGDGKDATGGSQAGRGGSPSSQGSGGVLGSGGGAGSPDAGVPGGGAVGSGGVMGTTDAGRDGTATGGAPGTDGGASLGGRGGNANPPGTGGASATGGRSGSGGAGGAGTLPRLTIWIAGDSTVANGSAPCPIGWGGQFKPYFGDQVAVTNNAIAGRSVQTWLYNVSATLGASGECGLVSTTFLPAWATILAGMKAGDYLFIQFGINDTDSACPRHVGTQLFQTYYGMMAQAAKDRGANPIFVTPVSSIACSGSRATGSRGTFATATKQAGVTFNVPVIDLEQLSVSLYNASGFCPLPGADAPATFEAGTIGTFFCEDHTHFETAGAVKIAGLVTQALRDQGIGLASYLK